MAKNGRMKKATFSFLCGQLLGFALWTNTVAVVDFLLNFAISPYVMLLFHLLNKFLLFSPILTGVKIFEC